MTSSINNPPGISQTTAALLEQRLHEAAKPPSRKHWIVGQTCAGIFKALHQILIAPIPAWFIHTRSKLAFVRSLIHISDEI
jgi:hypothetical protein